MAQELLKITIYVTPNEKEKLNEIATSQGRSMAQQAHVMLEKILNEN